MIWIVYQALFAVGFALILPYFLWRMRRRGGYRTHFGERFARYAPDVAGRLSAGGRIWIHAVSVGEIYVGLAFAREVRRLRPEREFVFSVNTPTARAITEAAMDPRDVLLYFPMDFPRIMRRALDAIRPRALVLMEGEWWPNLLRQAAGRGVLLALVNGRMSDRSFRGYRRIRPWMSRLLPLMRAMYVQSGEVRDRLIALGAPADRVVDAGSAKYDVAARDPEAETRARAALSALGWGPGSRILLGGSTWPGEEEILLDLFSRLRPDVPGLVLLLAPRHAERRAQVAAEIGRAGLSYILRSEQRSGRPPPAEAPAVFLLDTTGELRDFYASADLIFVGKSLTAHGGQNPIEPALCGRPVVVGPHMENFRPVLADFLEADAVVQVRDAAELDGVFRRLLSDPAAASAMGGRAAALVARKSGALSRTAAAMAEWL